MNGPQDIVRAHLAESSELMRETARMCAADIVGAALLVARTLKNGGKLLLCGNGGSAADCQHLAAEMVIRLTHAFNRPSMPAIALTTDSSILTACANDFGFDSVFSRQVEALGRGGDALLAISTSGSSKNVILAATQAKRSGLSVISLTGAKGSLSDLADVAIRVPGEATAHIQELHLSIEHVICHLVERELFGSGGPAA